MMSVVKHIMSKKMRGADLSGAIITSRRASHYFGSFSLVLCDYPFPRDFQGKEKWGNKNSELIPAGHPLCLPLTMRESMASSAPMRTALYLPSVKHMVRAVTVSPAMSGVSSTG